MLGHHVSVEKKKKTPPLDLVVGAFIRPHTGQNGATRHQLQKAKFGLLACCSFLFLIPSKAKQLVTQITGCAVSRTVCGHVSLVRGALVLPVVTRRPYLP